MREILVFFAVSAAAGGAVFAISFFRTGSVTGDALFVPVDLKLLLLSFLLIYPVLTLVFRRTAKRRKSGRHCRDYRFQPAAEASDCAPSWIRAIP